MILLVSSAAVFAAMRAIRGANSPDIPSASRVPERNLAGHIADYGVFISDVVTGDWGHSRVNGVPITELVAFHGRNSLALAAAALLAILVIGVPLGLLAASRRSGAFAGMVGFTTAVGFGFPHFWLGLLLIWLFGPTLGWLPAAGCCGIKHMVLPVAVLSVEGVALTARMTRSVAIEILERDYIRTLRAGGLDEKRILTRHVLRNALVPIISILGLRVGQLVSAAIIVEIVFGWPGIGLLVVRSILVRDYAVAQFFALVLVSTVVLANWIADIGYRLADPRLRRPTSAR